MDVHCLENVLFVPCTRLMKRGRKLVHENMSIRLRPAACVFLSLSLLVCAKLKKIRFFLVRLLFKCDLYLTVANVHVHVLMLSLHHFQAHASLPVSVAKLFQM